jgi:hypothetical protein
MQKIELNEKQQEFIGMVNSGEITLPSTSREFVAKLLFFLKTYDHDSVEKDLISSCEKCYLSTAKIKGDELGFAYRSAILPVLSKRGYFKQLAESMSNRGLDASREIENKLLQLGYVARLKKQVRVTVAGDQYLKTLKQAEY